MKRKKLVKTSLPYGVSISTSVAKSTSISPNKKLTNTKSKPSLTRSKLGTTKPVKSTTARKVNKWGTTTTLPYAPFHPWPEESLWEKLKKWFWDQFKL